MNPNFSDWQNLLQQMQKTATELKGTQSEMNKTCKILSKVAEDTGINTVSIKRHKTWHETTRWICGIIGMILGGVASQIKWAVLF